MDRRGEPWFEDGNIVLVTYRESIPTSFKVHRGMLARHSEMFRSMLQLAQPGQETLHDCPAVRMDDLPNELSNLIRALYDGPSFSDTSQEGFFYLAGVLRLSTKYFIKHLRASCIKNLVKTWSYSLKEHEAMVATAINAPLINNMSYPYIHPLHVLNLAHETHVRIVLPSAFYFLSLYPLDELLSADHPKLQISHPSKPPSILDASDIRPYTLMYQKRIDLILAFVRTVCGGRTTDQFCVDTAACSRRFTRTRNTLGNSWEVRTGPIHFMQQAYRNVQEDSVLCRACKVPFLQAIELFRENAWKELPSCIGLPSWEELALELDGT